MEDNSTSCLIIFIRNPEIGKVKSRIAFVKGEEKALEIYRELLQATREFCTALKGVQKILYYSNGIIPDDEWDNEVFEKRSQSGSDLGERMSAAIKECLAQYSSAILIGSDCPYLTPRHILSGFELLKTEDLVIGPAKDGGYYLIGMKKHRPNLFEDVEWGSSKVFEQTIQKAGKLKTGLLEKFSDIDTFEDYLAWKTPAN